MYWPIGAPKTYALTKHTKGELSTTPSGGHLTNGHGSDGVQAEALGGPVVSTEDGGPRTTPDVQTSASAPCRAPANAQADLPREDEILAAKSARRGEIFATMTQSGLMVWQAKPVVALAAITRSRHSLDTYGLNVALHVRPDALVMVLQTALDYLVTYTIATESSARIYHLQLPESERSPRQGSAVGYDDYRRGSSSGAGASSGENGDIREVSLRFRMVIRIDAGISTALALDDELLVATIRPAALQRIRWASEDGASPTSTELLSRMSWMSPNATITEFVHDRPMNLMCWIISDGRAYAVQRATPGTSGSAHPSPSFHGFCFHMPEARDDQAIKVAINARFSLIAVACAASAVLLYSVKDYVGNIPHLQTLQIPATFATTGAVTFLSYSPDGHCLFAGCEKGWAMWSVFGKLGATSFTADLAISSVDGERWLHGVVDGFWISGGCEMALLGNQSTGIDVVEMAKAASTANLSAANIASGLMHTTDTVTMYKGHDMADQMSMPTDKSLWQMVQIPATYLVRQRPIRCAVASADGKYIAVAGRRGVAHHSTTSGRWKTFSDPGAETEFSVRGGMCWHLHFLIASVESGNQCEIRVYSRERSLDYSHIMHTVSLTTPAILTVKSGADSLLVYTHDNTLLHFVISVSGSAVKLVQVGQIGFHGIIRAPTRVRALSWILPEYQLEHGDPSQDVATASVLFLVDGKLVLLQPSANEQGELKYDMRVIAQSVEYYILSRDQPAASSITGNLTSDVDSRYLGHSLRDSLWYFDGDSLHVWSDVQDVLAFAPAELGRELPPAVRISLDFYPISAMVAQGVVHGLDAELVQRRDVNFSFYRQTPRTQLFLPQVLQHHIAEYNSPAALHLANSYQHLPYFAHALEVLLHTILDLEVDDPPSPPETALLPTTVSFLSSFPAYLDIIVNCTRKTELRSWRTLFSHLPPVMELFEQSLDQGKLKTASGYLLVLHTFEQDSFQVHEFARILRLAAAEQDWELCKELARFLVGIDPSGQTMAAALREAGLAGTPRRLDEGTNGGGTNGGVDYFSLGRDG